MLSFFCHPTDPAFAFGGNTITEVDGILLYFIIFMDFHFSIYAGLEGRMYFDFRGMMLKG